LRITGGALSEQRIVYLGAGGAGVGIASLMAAAMTEETDDKASVAAAQFILDSHGLIYEGRALDDAHKRQFALTKDAQAKYGFSGHGEHNLLEVISKVRPTVLIGTTAQPGIFSEVVVREMSKHVERPIIFPLSNPTSKVECTPEEALRYSGGRAIVATGTAFDPVPFERKVHVVGQANNVFVFPGVGLGCILAQPRAISDSVFLVAARALARLVSDDRLESGAIYPDQGELRAVSAAVAAAVVREVNRQGAGREIRDDSVEQCVRNAMWQPEYAH
jgi:malic enzyme